jgi:hypothetical protein
MRGPQALKRNYFRPEAQKNGGPRAAIFGSFLERAGIDPKDRIQATGLKQTSSQWHDPQQIQPPQRAVGIQKKPRNQRQTDYDTRHAVNAANILCKHEDILWVHVTQ